MVITISRQFGSGGREFARRLADALGYSYWDNEILTKCSQEGGIDEAYLQHVSQHGLANFYSSTIATRFSGRINNSLIQSAEATGQLCSTLRLIAQEDNCVIVGRAADAILGDLKPLRIFVHADRASRLRRCLDRCERKGEVETEKDIEHKMKTIDRGRERFYSLFSERKWGERENYDLCINTSGKVIKSLVPAFCVFVNELEKKS